MAAVDRCLESIQTIKSYWPSLLAVRHPGSGSAQHNAPPGIEQARALRAERAETGSAGGTAKAFQAPCDLAVVMAIESVELSLAVAHDQLLAVHELPRTCSRCLHPITVHSYVDRDRGDCAVCTCVGFRLVRVPAHAHSWRQLLSTTEVAEGIEFRLAVAAREVEQALDLIETGWLLTSYCPWCQGINDAMPGGSFTLRAFTPGAANETYVECFNPICDPPRSACERRVEGRPHWPFEDLDWLMQQLNVVDFKRRRKTLLPPAVVTESFG